MSVGGGHDHGLKLRAGELVHVRSAAEILSTLDSNGRLGALPFMPEMLQYCGKQYRVHKRAHKTCDTIHSSGGRRMQNTVHLADLRCDGASHGGCQARCLLFWKEAWLERVHPSFLRRGALRIGKLFGGDQRAPAGTGSDPVTLDGLHRSTKSSADCPASGEEVYACQATDLLKASRPLRWWDVRQYIEDVTSGNVTLLQVFSALLYFVIKRTLKFGAYRAQLWTYNRIHGWMGEPAFPFRGGELKKTPTGTLNLQPGEFVQIKTNQEILETLDHRSKNRGLLFDFEEAAYCGGRYEVLQRVEHIINEKTGKMMWLPGECVMLNGVTCRALYSDRRIFCPRGVYSYWREIWLRRVG
jgi:hypothetical protein